MVFWIFVCDIRAVVISMVFAHTQVSSVVTGLVIDVITSNYCHGCELEHKSSFAEWSAANKSDCPKKCNL